MKTLTPLGPWGDGELHSAAPACTDTRPRGLSACRPPTPALACSWWKPASFRWPLCGGSPPRSSFPPGTHHPAGVLTTGKGTGPFPLIPKHCVSLGCLPGMRPREVLKLLVGKAHKNPWEFRQEPREAPFGCHWREMEELVEQGSGETGWQSLSVRVSEDVTAQHGGVRLWS